MVQGKSLDIGKPELLAADVLNGSKIRLRWNAADGAEKYIIKRSDTADGKFTRIGVVSKKLRFFIDDSVKEGETYFYSVSSFKRLSPEQKLQKRSRIISVSVDVIESPELNKLTVDKDNKVTIAWEPCKTAVDGYIILRRFDFMEKPLTIADIGADERRYTDSKIVLGQFYHYSVQGYCRLEDGTMVYGLPSAEKSVICFDVPAVLSVKSKPRKRVSFSLRLTAGADGYILTRSDEQDGEYIEVDRTEEDFAFNLKDIGKKKHKKAYYEVSCIKKYKGKEFIGPPTQPIEVRYK